MNNSYPDSKPIRIALCLAAVWLVVSPLLAGAAQPLLSPQLPYDAASFYRFAARCERDHRPYMLSLKQVAEEYERSVRPGVIPAERLRYLHGFNSFFGYWIDREQGDVFLLGLHDPNLPPVNIDCLVTAFRAAYQNKMPSCSLDPHPDPRYQKSVIGGIPWQTRWAEIMIAADYDMKRVCQGQVDTHINDLKSWVDQQVQQMQRRGGRDGSHEQDRWWFNRPKKEVPRTLLLDERGDAVLLYCNPVVVMTELYSNGKYGTGATAPEAERFAEKFTRNLPTFAQMFPSIGELLALYRLLDLAVHLKVVGQVEPPNSEFWLIGYRHPYRGPSPTMPTLTRKISDISTPNGMFTFTVQGGVRMPLALDCGLFEMVPKGLPRRDLQPRPSFSQPR